MVFNQSKCLAFSEKLQIFLGHIYYSRNCTQSNFPAAKMYHYKQSFILIRP